MVSSSPPSAAGLDPQLLAEIESLHLLSRQAAQGALAGMHRSQRRGTSIEFSEHRLYTPGDEIRHIDWHAYAKTDRFHIKQFEDETHLVVELLIDHSASMGFVGNGTGLAKLAYARVLAAALAHLALRQSDATGLTAFAREVTDTLPPRTHSAHLMEILARLARLQPTDTTGIAACIDHFAQTRRRRTVAILFSDLFDPNPELLSAFRRLQAQRHDVVVLHVLDPAELDFPYELPATFHSLEDERKLFVHPRTLRQTYVTEMRRYLESTARRMMEIGIDYHTVRTDEIPAEVLGTFLRARQRSSG